MLQPLSRHCGHRSRDGAMDTRAQTCKSTDATSYGYHAQGEGTAMPRGSVASGRAAWRGHGADTTAGAGPDAPWLRLQPRAMRCSDRTQPGRHRARQRVVAERPPIAEPTDAIEYVTVGDGARVAYGDELARRPSSSHPSDTRWDSKVLSLPCNHRSSTCAVRSSRFLRNAHSQTIATLHPASRRRRRFRVSRFTLAWNFTCQNPSRVAGVVAYGHPACRCQKQP